MERLVVDLEKITFQGNFQNQSTENGSLSSLSVDCPQLLKFTIKNCLPNMNIHCDGLMPEKRTPPPVTNDEDENDTGNSDLNSTDDTVSNDSFDDNTELDAGSGSNEAVENHAHSTGGIRKLRNLPQRKSKLKSDGKRNLRISMKPGKINAKSTGKLSPAEIRQLYSKQKLTSFLPSKLETIFEEPQPVRGRSVGTQSDGESQFRLIGSIKLKRSLECNHGYTIPKTLLKQRRAKIKKNFGHRSAWKKMPLESFMEHMKKNLSAENEEDSNECDLRQSPALNETPTEVADAIVKEEEKMAD